MFITSCSQEIQTHYKNVKNTFSGMSKSIQNDLISCTSEYVLNKIKNEILMIPLIFLKIHYVQLL